MAKANTKPQASGAEEGEIVPPPPGIAHYQSRVRHQCAVCTGTIHMERNGELGCARHMREVLAHQMAARVRAADARLAAYDAKAAQPDFVVDAARRDALVAACAEAREHLEVDRDLGQVEEGGDKERFAGRRCPTLVAWDAPSEEGFTVEVALLDLDDLEAQWRGYMHNTGVSLEGK